MFLYVLKFQKIDMFIFDRSWSNLNLTSFNKFCSVIIINTQIDELNHR